MAAVARAQPSLSAWPTPRRLRAYQIAVWALSALLLLVGEGTLSRARGSMKTIGKDAGPSILAAQEIRASLADLDANAANLLLGTPAQRTVALDVFEKRRVQATGRLVDAAQNITYEGERVPIQSMMEELGRYLELVVEARLRYDSGSTRGGIETYRTASARMHDKILVAAQTLDQVNRTYMDDMYDEQTRASAGAEGLAVALGGGLIAVLVALQLFLLRRTRRMINPPIAVATLFAIVFTAYLVHAFGQARDDLRVAKKDAFDSIHALWKARAIAYDANGDESRWLLDRENADAHQAAFDDRVRALTTDPEITTSKQLEAHTVAFDGLFADELRNITFHGEREAATEMLTTYRAYYAIDRRIRALERGGKHAEAVELCIGTASDESNAAFERFDQALGKVLRINRDAFDQVIDEGQDALARAATLDPLAAIVIAFLTWFGLRPRLREYDG